MAAEITSRVATKEYRDNFDRIFTRVVLDKFADLITLRALRGGKEILNYQLTGHMLWAAVSAQEAVKPFWSNIPGLTPEEGLEITQEAIEQMVK